MIRLPEGNKNTAFTVVRTWLWDDPSTESSRPNQPAATLRDRAARTTTGDSVAGAAQVEVIAFIDSANFAKEVTAS